MLQSRRGVSPVIATTIILAITVVLGLSLWSFANSGVGAATQSYSEAVTEYGKFTGDRFVVPSVAFNHPSNGHVTVWVYNSGKLDTTINTVLLTCKDCVSFTPIQLGEVDLISGSMIVSAKSLQEMDFDAIVTFTTGKTYQVQVISETGAYQTTFQKV
ncbi:MAG: archaellin/type IV pilin N-terminal domain-containing protein [Nitrososphaerales archaeon]